MLKRKLWRAGFFGQGLLLAAVPLMSMEQEPAEMETISGVRYSMPADSSLSDSAMTIAPEYPEIKMNPGAVSFVSTYKRTHKRTLEEVRERSPRYFRIIDTVLSRYQLPLELRYLAVIESELKKNAVSHVGAKGPWQLMPETARILGLKVNGTTDERTHYYKSSVAAAKYLRDLYAKYGDWLLVIAAYNAGPGAVYKAIKRSGSRDFWKLQQYLPLETRNHVKKFIAAQYYFEGQGSITTLTKKETEAYQEKLETYKLAVNALESQQSTTSAAIMSR